jgi:hypothetical protein
MLASNLREAYMQVGCESMLFCKAAGAPPLRRAVFDW